MPIIPHMWDDFWARWAPSSHLIGRSAMFRILTRSSQELLSSPQGAPRQSSRPEERPGVPKAGMLSPRGSGAENSALRAQ